MSTETSIQSLATRFPKDFVFGTATASYQIEGAAMEEPAAPVALAEHPNVAIVRERIDTLPREGLTIVATGPLTADGQWLYFTSSRNFATTGNGSPWGDRNTGPFFGFRSKLYAVALQPAQHLAFGQAELGRHGGIGPLRQRQLAVQAVDEPGVDVVDRLQHIDRLARRPGGRGGAG